MEMPLEKVARRYRESATERKRRQREWLREHGLTQVTVTWPIDRLEELREIEREVRVTHELDYLGIHDDVTVTPRS